MITPDLLKHIRESLEKGVPQDELFKELIAAGNSSEDVIQAMNVVRAALYGVKVPQSMPHIDKKSTSHVLSWVMFISVLILGAAGVAQYDEQAQFKLPNVMASIPFLTAPVPAPVEPVVYDPPAPPTKPEPAPVTNAFENPPISSGHVSSVAHTPVPSSPIANPSQTTAPQSAPAPTQAASPPALAPVTVSDTVSSSSKTIYYPPGIPVTSSQATMTQPSGIVSFSSTWDDGQILAPGRWHVKQAVAAYSMQVVSDVVRAGSQALRVEVRPGDDPLGLGTERAEVAEMTNTDGSLLNESLSSGTQYYAFSVRLDPNWVSPGSFGLILQLHGPNNVKASPSFGLNATDRFWIQNDGGDLDSNTPHNYQLSDSSLALGHWVDFVIKLKFAVDSTGEITVWRRDEGQTDFTQVLDVNAPTLQYRSSVSTNLGYHYWKEGLYRAVQAPNGPTNILWLDGLTRASTFDAAVQNAFPNAAPISNPVKELVASTVNVPVSSTSPFITSFIVIPTSIPLGGMVTISGTSVNTTRCYASISWAGSYSPNFSRTQSNIQHSQIYGLTCSGPNGTTTTAYQQVTVDPFATTTATSTQVADVYGAVQAIRQWLAEFVAAALRFVQKEIVQLSSWS